jgi:pilus assembly protein CpaB
LAVIGATLLLSYVAGADRRALAGVETVSVLVVTEPIAKGTAGDRLTSSVKAKMLPAVALGPGAVAQLSQLTGKVATTDLVPGEQLMTSRFADPATLEGADKVKVPKGMQEISLALESQRVVGGQLATGSTVGLFLSLPKDVDRPAQTRLVMNKVLVTRVQGNVAGSKTGLSSAAASTAVLVTLAMTAADAERVVFGAENGTVWLSAEPADADETGTRLVNAENVYR